jgi:4-hydroxybenzoate polyprenyltransferase
MGFGTAKRWRFLSRVLKLIGALSFILSFMYSMVLISYYSTKRPHVPQPERGWTVGLIWTHPPSYGTAQEENRLQWLHWWLLPSFCLIALGEAVKIYKLGDYSGVAAVKSPPFSKY